MKDGMKAASRIAAMATMAAMFDSISHEALMPKHGSKYAKTPLNKKQTKQRQKNKVAKKQRKNNRKN